MEFHNTDMAHGPEVSGAHCSVKATAPLVEVFQKTAESGRPYLFVEDDDGYPLGILAAEDVLRRVTDPHPVEFARWMDMPAEAALQSRMEVPEPVENINQKHETEYTRVSKDGVLLGVITDSDVLISWRSIQKTLTTSQGDAVTGLPNRTTFDYQLEAECNRARRCLHSVSVIMVDLDFFKQVNDQFGHAAGDAALHAVGTTLRSTLRSYDMVARFGGDEFSVICSGCRPGEIDIVLRRIREAVTRLQFDPTAPRPVPTISVGAAVAHDLDEISHSNQIIEAADEALYAAKEAGRNCAYKCEFGHAAAAKTVFVEDRYSHSSEPLTV